MQGQPLGQRESTVQVPLSWQSLQMLFSVIRQKDILPRAYQGWTLPQGGGSILRLRKKDCQNATDMKRLEFIYSGNRKRDCWGL